MVITVEVAQRSDRSGNPDSNFDLLVNEKLIDRECKEAEHSGDTLGKDYNEKLARLAGWFGGRIVNGAKKAKDILVALATDDTENDNSDNK